MSLGCCTMKLCVCLLFERPTDFIQIEADTFSCTKIGFIASPFAKRLSISRRSYKLNRDTTFYHCVLNFDDCENFTQMPPTSKTNS